MQPTAYPAAIETLDKANPTQETAKGAKQQATQEQDVVLTMMNDWVAQYLKIAKVARRQVLILADETRLPRSSRLRKSFDR